MNSIRWTRDQVKLAFHLYCQLPFGKLHSKNPEIIRLASLIGRTPSAVAMKLVNLASLDPSITETGRKGLGNASDLDREVWNEFHADWERVAVECAATLAQFAADQEPAENTDDEVPLSDYTGETRAVISQQRVRQTFFRRAVLASYNSRCCMSGLAESRLLVASHIVPWKSDKTNRLNPSNGLCLSAIHDKAFDRGLISLSDHYEVLVSEELKRSNDHFIAQVLIPLEGQQIQLPKRFVPTKTFVAHHRCNVFLDNSR